MTLPVHEYLVLGLLIRLQNISHRLAVVGGESKHAEAKGLKGKG